ncbi:wall-associated receptor kinase-like 14 isoform X2 [Apium graveolens]|uniref:wall-associated receptor kinase-like 14 isoform X2 n=1 Tax=Apium graveolens TaxID=4045 RepID=UPI003D79EF54
MEITVLVVMFFTVLFLAQPRSSTCCNLHCGTNITVQYPFGFSEGCGIRLDCNDNKTMSLGKIIVKSVTSDNILLHFPANCSRKINESNQLIGPNYAPTKRNNFLIRRCNKPLVNKCLIQANSSLINDHLSASCNDDGVSCYRGEGRSVVNELNMSDCSVLYTSILINSNNNKSADSVVLALEFEVVELEWGIPGNCNCSTDAKCVRVRLEGVNKGFRCQCTEGFEGDGFRGGCRRVSYCSASRYISGKCGGTKRVVILAAVAAAGACLIAALALICYYVRRRSTSRKYKMSENRLLGEARNSTVPLFSYKDIERATNAFSEKQKLGTGAYGTVYAGKLHNDEWVAIKKLRHQDTDGIEQIMNEIKLLSSVSHQNLVRLLGCCIENGEQILVYEFMPNGTLAQHLQRERGHVLPWTVRLTIATETALAIAHLHTATHPPIYHRDIKSSNILLDVNFNSKVADFGLSRLGMTDNSHVSTAPQGTPGYVDPQYHQNFHLSDKSDVYSFGVVLVEIVTALKVVDFSRPATEINLAALAIDRIGRGRVDEIIDPLLEPNRDAWTLSSIHKVAELAFRCLAFHRDMRPSMVEVSQELEQIRLGAWAPLDENIGMASSIASSCSSPFDGSEKSQGGATVKKLGVGSRRVVVPHRPIDCLTPMKEVSDSSPISMRDPWSSEQSSPSTNSLLRNIVH